MTKTLTVAQHMQYAPTHPARTAYRSRDDRFDSDIIVKEWKTREAMLRAIEREDRQWQRMRDLGRTRRESAGWILYAK